MGVVTKPMIEDVELRIRRDVSNAEVGLDFTINWSSFDQLTNLAYREKWELVGVDPAGNTTTFVGPQLVNGIDVGAGPRARATSGGSRGCATDTPQRSEVSEHTGTALSCRGHPYGVPPQCLVGEHGEHVVGTARVGQEIV